MVNVELGLVGIFILEWTVFFFFVPDEWFFSLAGNVISGNLRRCKQYTVRAHVFSHAHFVSVLVPACCHSCPGRYRHIVTHWRHAHAWLILKEHIVSVSPLDCTEHVHSLLIFDTIFLTRHPLLSEPKPCAGPRRNLSGAVAEPSSLTGYELKQLAENQDTGISPKTSSLLNTRIFVSNLLFFHQLSTASTYDSAESIVTPFRTWTMSKFVLCWPLHCTYGSEKQMRNGRKFITLIEKTWCPVHHKIRWVQGELSRCFQAKVGWIKKRFPIEKMFPKDIHRFLGATNFSSDSLTR